jgi:hypothetical protein
MTNTGNPIKMHLRALADLVATAAWPPWSDPSFDRVMGEFRDALLVDMDGGRDLCTLYAMASDDETLRGWVTDLIEPISETPPPAIDALVALLRVHLFNDELVHLGLVASRSRAPAVA